MIGAGRQGCWRDSRANRAPSASQSFLLLYGRPGAAYCPLPVQAPPANLRVWAGLAPPGGPEGEAVLSRVLLVAGLRTLVDASLIAGSGATSWAPCVCVCTCLCVSPLLSC